MASQKHRRERMKPNYVYDIRGEVTNYLENHFFKSEEFKKLVREKAAEILSEDGKVYTKEDLKDAWEDGFKAGRRH